MATLASIADLKTQLIRKALTGACFVAPSTATAVTHTTLLPSGALMSSLPSNYKSAGVMTKDGVVYSRATENSEVESWGFADPTRSDKTKDTDTFKVVFQETRKPVLELFTGASLASTQLTVNGSLSIQKPNLPPDPYYRMLFVAEDFYNGQPVVMARFYPLVKATAYDDQAWTDGQEIRWGMTFQAYPDTTLGYTRDDIFGGAGFLALATAMGFTVASS